MTAFQSWIQFTRRIPRFYRAFKRFSEALGACDPTVASQEVLYIQLIIVKTLGAVLSQSDLVLALLKLQTVGVIDSRADKFNQLRQIHEFTLEC